MPIRYIASRPSIACVLQVWKHRWLVVAHLSCGDGRWWSVYVMRWSEVNDRHCEVAPGYSWPERASEGGSSASVLQQATGKGATERETKDEGRLLYCFSSLKLQHLQWLGVLSAFLLEYNYLFFQKIFKIIFYQFLENFWNHGIDFIPIHIMNTAFFWALRILPQKITSLFLEFSSKLRH